MRGQAGLGGVRRSWAGSGGVGRVGWGQAGLGGVRRGWAGLGGVGGRLAIFRGVQAAFQVGQAEFQLVDAVAEQF